MKINIVADKSQSKGDYTNILIDDNIINELNSAADDGEATEIVFHESLCCITSSLIINTIQAAARKLSRGGKLIIVDWDAYEIAMRFTRNRIQIEEFNGLIYGQRGQRKATLTIFGLVNHITKNLGLKCMKRRLDGVMMYLEFERQ